MSGRIVVGVDGSHGAEAALRWAIDEGRRRDATVEVVLAWEYPYLDRLGRSVREELQRQADEHLTAILGGVVAGETAGPEITGRAVHGGPAAVLLDAAAGADLVVVGRRGHGGLTELVLGSVSSACVHHAACPVAVVPSGDR